MQSWADCDCIVICIVIWRYGSISYCVLLILERWNSKFQVLNFQRKDKTNCKIHVEPLYIKNNLYVDYLILIILERDRGCSQDPEDSKFLNHSLNLKSTMCWIRCRNVSVCPQTLHYLYNFITEKTIDTTDLIIRQKSVLPNFSQSIVWQL